MPTILTTASGFRSAIMERLASDTRLVERAALDACLGAVADAVALTNAEGAVDLGGFKAAWGARPEPRGAVLENTAPYAGVLEYGRRPGRPGPPLWPIVEWVHRKFGGTFKAEFRAARAIGLGAVRAMQASIATSGGSRSWKAAARAHARAQQRMITRARMGGFIRGRGPGTGAQGPANRDQLTGAVGSRTFLVARAIRDKIHNRGTSPRRLLGRTVPKLRARFERAALRELRRPK